MNHKLKSFTISMCLSLGFMPMFGQQMEELKQGFLNPTKSAQPRVWWHWMNGNITKDGIRKDLLWMNKTGIAGFHVFDAGLETPQIVEKRLVYMTPEWKEAFHYAIKTADSLGMEMTIASSPGWSETGGPWVKDEDGMKKLVWRQMDVVGGKKLKVKLPEGFTLPGQCQDFHCVPAGTVASSLDMKSFYRDTYVLAMRLPEADKTMFDLNPVVTSSGGTVSLEHLANDSLNDFDTLTVDANGKTWVDFDFGKEQTIKSFTWTAVNKAGSYTSFTAHLLSSSDGKVFKEIQDFGYQGSMLRTQNLKKPVTARYFRVLLTPNDKKAQECLVSMLRLEPVNRVHFACDKAGFGTYRYGFLAQSPTKAPIEEVVKLADVIDVTSFVKDGVLEWNAPQGRWRILRLGYALTGKTNHPASPEATGLEVDKLDPVAIRSYFKNYLATYQDAAKGMLGEHGIGYVLNDSYEAGIQTWTQRIREEFMKRKGYDPIPWLPTCTGMLINSQEDTERFLFDWRMVIGDMMTEYHYDMPGELLKGYGLKRYVETHENARANLTDGMDCKRTADVPMSAIWMGYNQKRISAPRFEADIRESASVAHIFGQNIAAAESFTTDGFRDGALVYTPSVLKPTADKAMASGLNRFVIHTSPHQPVDNKVPGLGLGKYGQWFDRHETWADMAHYWASYLSRSCYLLQQGHFVADVACYYGENNNVTGCYNSRLPKMPVGYSYDFVNPNILYNYLQVDGQELTTTTGMRYKVLWLDNIPMASMKMLRQLKHFADAGITIAGSKPLRLAGMEGSQEEFDNLVKDIWGSGRKNVSTNVPLEKILAQKGVEADVTFGNIKSDMSFVHRKLQSGDIYWVANHTANSKQDTFSFRVTGKKPVVWHADTGRMEDVSYSIEGGRTKVQLSLVPYDAVFVLFVEDTQQLQATIAAPVYTTMTQVVNPWKVTFQEQRGAPKEISLASLTSLTEVAEPGVKYFSGVATYSNTFTVSKKQLKKKVCPKRIWLDLGDVEDLAEVTINGHTVGCVWKTPYKIDITEWVKAGDNVVEVRVANPWHNRMVGDEQPGMQRVTYSPIKFYKANEPLMPSGLMGPVQVVGEQ